MRPYRGSHRGPFLAIALVAVIGAGIQDVHAQDPQTKGKEEPKLGWSNTSDLSLVVSGGNSDSATLGFSDKLRYRWKEARLELKVLLQETLRRFPDIELAGEPTRARSLFLNQLKTLPVRFTPEPS